jgi:hypothetical protein
MLKDPILKVLREKPLKVYDIGVNAMPPISIEFSGPEIYIGESDNCARPSSARDNVAEHQAFRNVSALGWERRDEHGTNQQH